MAYYSGTAASLTALRTALLTHAQADGWTLTGDVLSKAGVYFRIQETATNITCLGCESNAVANPAPETVNIGLIYYFPTQAERKISFPCTYEVFGFAQELYLIVNYDVAAYQWMAFGKSAVQGMPGQGGWCGASAGSTYASGTASGLPAVQSIEPSAGGVYASRLCSALFWLSYGGSQAARNCWVNHGLDGHGWMWGGAINYSPIGIRSVVPLISTQPNSWNSESVLLPIRAWKERPAYKSSMVADLLNARHVRIDNFTPGDIITIGPDKWKVFPWYIKNITYRDGTAGAPLTYDHTGTFGWAIRYEGP